MIQIYEGSFRAEVNLEMPRPASTGMRQLQQLTDPQRAG
jgi:hypothetical protein